MHFDHKENTSSLQSFIEKPLDDDAVVSDGILYMVATPIGNLEDITYRAVRILKNVDVILCEDTRTSKILLHHYAISTPVQAFHEFSTTHTLERIIQKIQSGVSMALITDAGTPMISDPGFALLQAVYQSNIVVRPIPGSSSLTAALSVSPIPIHTFLFLGFLPKTEQKLKKTFQTYVSATYPIMFFESPRRLQKTLSVLYNTCGDGDIFFAREITKYYEQYIKHRLSYMVDHAQDFIYKGEFTVIYKNDSLSDHSVLDQQIMQLNDFLQNMGTKDRASFIAQQMHISKRRVYALIGIKT